MKINTLAIIIAACSVTSVNAASFDCNLATTKVEKMICSSENLQDLDIELNDVYKQALAVNTSEVKAEQRKWIRLVRNKQTDVDGMAFVYESRIDSLNAIVESAKPVQAPAIVVAKPSQPVIAPKSQNVEIVNPYTWKSNITEFEEGKSHIKLNFVGDDAEKDVAFVFEPNAGYECEFGEYESVSVINGKPVQMTSECTLDLDEKLVLFSAATTWAGSEYIVNELSKNDKITVDDITYTTENFAKVWTSAEKAI